MQSMHIKGNASYAMVVMHVIAYHCMSHMMDTDGCIIWHRLPRLRMHANYDDDTATGAAAALDNDDDDDDMVALLALVAASFNSSLSRSLSVNLTHTKNTQ